MQLAVWRPCTRRKRTWLGLLAIVALHAVLAAGSIVSLSVVCVFQRPSCMHDRPTLKIMGYRQNYFFSHKIMEQHGNGWSQGLKV